MNILEIKLKSLSPIAITKRVFGPLYETEIFIPAWTMWHTFVKLYALASNRDYKKAEQDLTNLRLTNFYILEHSDIIVPFKMDNDDKNFSFDKRGYVTSEFKTAIDPLSNTSLLGALYEREFIKKKDFVGWIKTENQVLKEFFTSLKGSIFFIGADKNTGFGKIKIEEVSEIFSVSGQYANKIRDSLSRADLGNYIIPPEFTGKEELYFPLILRRWDEEKGVGMKVEYVENIQ